MVGSESKLIENRLARPDIHQQWEAAYRTVENEKFSELAFDYITQILNAPQQSIFLDAGCGTCAHAIRLANRGLLVQAVDFSASVLEVAEANVKASGLETKIKSFVSELLMESIHD